MAAPCAAWHGHKHEFVLCGVFIELPKFEGEGGVKYGVQEGLIS